MQVVQGDQVEWIRGLEYRGGTFHSRTLLEGRPGGIDNFQVTMGRSDKDFLSPRHRHNFEQFRFQLEGDLDFGRDGTMTPGVVGYFPEGAPYGPQTSEGDAMTVVLQFGGASGQGYLSRQEVRQGMNELRATGTFEGGVYRRNPGVPGPKNRDGYQAIWEHVNERLMDYPKARYPGPIMMDPARYAWVPLDGQPGVAQKLLGVFTERRAQVDLVRIEAGGCYRAVGRGVFVATRGAGRIVPEPLRAYTAFFLDWGETAEVAAEDEIEMIHFGLPDLRGLMVELDSFDAVAAE